MHCDDYTKLNLNLPSFILHSVIFKFPFLPDDVNQKGRRMLWASQYLGPNSEIDVLG